MRDIEKIKKIIDNTIENIELWYDVLQCFSEITGAPKGIIALRDRLTAELIVPSDVRHDLNSPLLYGFSEQEVESYISHYFKFDPWTEFEKLYHPITPYPLSKYVGIKALQASSFWEWLEPQGIGDTVVLDIGTFSKNWVAMNIYYPFEDNSIKQKALRYTSDLQGDMQRAWRYGQRYRVSQHNLAYLKYFIEQQSHAAFLLEPDGILIVTNKKGSNLLNKNLGFYVDAKQNFRIRDKKIREEVNSEIQKIKNRQSNFFVGEPVEIQVSDKGVAISITLIAGIEDKIGADRSMRLITVRKVTDEQKFPIDQPIWDNPDLTKRERQLVELMANGKRIVDFTRIYGIKKPTGHFHWGNVKRKLKVKNQMEIYAQHKIFTKNL